MPLQIEQPSFVHPNAKLGKNVKIGRFVHIGPNVTIEDEVEVYPNVYIDGHTIIKSGCKIYPFSSIGAGCQDLKYKGEKTFVVIGRNTTIRECVTINVATGEGNSTIVGNNCLIMAYSHIAHNCVIGDNVIMANGSTLAGHVRIYDFAVIGGLTAIHQFTRIGKYVIIGGCSKVVQDIPPFMMADGHPAKVYSLNNVGLRRHNFSLEERKRLKVVFKILFRSGLNTKNALKKIEESFKEDFAEIKEILDFIRSSERGIAK